MLIKELNSNRKNTWRFSVLFDCEYGTGQEKLVELLGNRKTTADSWRWFLLQDLPWNMSRNREEQMKNGWFVGGHRRKGSIHVFSDDCVVLLKLLTA